MEAPDRQPEGPGYGDQIMQGTERMGEDAAAARPGNRRRSLSHTSRGRVFPAAVHGCVRPVPLSYSSQIRRQSLNGAFSHNHQREGRMKPFLDSVSRFDRGGI